MLLRTVLRRIDRLVQKKDILNVREPEEKNKGEAEEEDSIVLVLKDKDSRNNDKMGTEV